MSESRFDNIKKNIIAGNIGNVITLLLSVVSRTVFIRYLELEYLGVNGLFTNILGLLSFTELGIGTAMNYSLYKPIAENNQDKVKALLLLYKKAYRIVATVVTVIGLSLIPIIPNLINTEEVYEDLILYYLIFLFNTVSSYFVTHKYAYVNALQKAYILTNASTIAGVVISGIQIISIFVFRNFLLYLLVQSVLGLIRNILMILFIESKYPILKEKPNCKVDSDTLKEIKINVKALIFHKIGEASVHQTDNIIISYFVSTLAVGKMSNYIMLQNAIARFTQSIFNSVTASVGNFIVKESKNRQEKLLQDYLFVGYWIYGFVFISFISLIQPLFILWSKLTNVSMIVDDVTMFLYFFSLYLANIGHPLYNFKVAAGIFDDDKWLAVLQAVVNLVASIICVYFWGLPGVYLGTLIQRLVTVLGRPIIVYKIQFAKSARKYFFDLVKYVFATLLIGFINKFILSRMFDTVSILSFCGMVVVTVVLPNLLFYCLFRKESSCDEFIRKMKGMISNG